MARSMHITEMVSHPAAVLYAKQQETANVLNEWPNMCARNVSDQRVFMNIDYNSLNLHDTAV